MEIRLSFKQLVLLVGLGLVVLFLAGLLFGAGWEIASQLLAKPPKATFN